MMTVIDQASPWLMPRSTLAATTHSQLGPHMIMNGTGRPNSHPATSTCFRPHVSASCPDTRLANALITPKLMMKETISVVEERWNSSAPISGTTVRSMPTRPPTKALIRTSNANWRQLASNPSEMPLRRAVAGVLVSVVLIPPLPSTGIDCTDLCGLRRRRRHIGNHGTHKLRFVADAECFVEAPFKTDR